MAEREGCQEGLAFKLFYSAYWCVLWSRGFTVRQKSRWEEESTKSSASSSDGQPPSARARRSGSLNPSWVRTTSVLAPRSRKFSVTTVSQSCAALPDQV